MSLINVASCCFYSPELTCFTWLMILTKIHSYWPCVFGADCSAVSDIYNVYIIIQSHYKVCATATFAVVDFLRFLKFLIHKTNIALICFMSTFGNGWSDIIREVRLHNDLVVEVLLQILCTLVTAVAIIHGKYLNLWPVWLRHFRFFQNWLNDVEDDCNTVFIGFPHETYVSVCSEAPHHPKTFVRRLWVLKRGQIWSSTHVKLRWSLRWGNVVISDNFVLISMLWWHFWGFWSML
jgi:hypothetical protein